MKNQQGKAVAHRMEENLYLHIQKWPWTKQNAEKNGVWLINSSSMFIVLAKTGFANQNNFKITLYHTEKAKQLTSNPGGFLVK